MRRAGRCAARVANAFRTLLLGVGLASGKDYVLEPSWADGHYERFPLMAQAVVARQHSGAVVAYTAQAALAQMAAVYIRKILAGASPGELPVQQPTALDLVVNLRVANALKLAVPQALLLRASKVIE